MNKYMKDFIGSSIEAYGYFLTLVCIVTHAITHSLYSCDWNAPGEHLELFIFRLSEMLAEHSIFFLYLYKFLGFSRVLKYPQVYDEQYNEQDHLLYTKINLLYNSDMGLPVSPSQSSNLNPLSSRCVTRWSLYAMGSDFGPSA